MTLSAEFHPLEEKIGTISIPHGFNGGIEFQVGVEVTTVPMALDTTFR